MSLFCVTGVIGAAGNLEEVEQHDEDAIGPQAAPIAEGTYDRLGRETFFLALHGTLDFIECLSAEPCKA